MSSVIKNPEDMSRDELLKGYKELMAGAMVLQNRPTLQRCPFCFGTTQVPFIKVEVKEELIKQWHTDVTQEEWFAFWIAKYPPPNAVKA